jgi:aspartyl-tRNA(Asn)/glutamyl-tRNA(Gln) amidotransferase subunit B
VARQTAILRSGGNVEQETLHFDPRTEAITSLRSKEEAHDYRYFPEPDLTPVAITEAMRDRAAAALPELPLARAERFEKDLGLSADSAHLLAFRTELGDFFEAALGDNGAHAAEPQPLANWVANELVSRLGADADPSESKVQPGALAKLVAMVTAKEVTQGGARQVLDKLVADGGEPQAIVAAEGLGAVGGADELAPIVEAALAANAAVAEKLRGGDMKPIGVIVGHVMRETKGRADGGEITRLVRRQLGL